MMRYVALLMLLFVGSVGCGSPEPCIVQSAEYFDEVDRIWDMIPDLYTGSPLDEIEMLDVLNNMVEETIELNPPRCAQDVQDSFAKFLEVYVDLAEAELNGDDSDLEIKGTEFSNALKAYSTARSNIEFSTESSTVAASQQFITEVVVIVPTPPPSKEPTVIVETLEKCDVPVDEYLSEVEKLNRRWFQAYEDSLDAWPVDEIMRAHEGLEGIIDEARALNPPECAIASKEALVKLYELLMEAQYQLLYGTLDSEELLDLDEEIIKAVNIYCHYFDTLELACPKVGP